MVWSLKCCFAILFLSTIQPSRTRAMTTQSPSGQDTCGRLRRAGTTQTWYSESFASSSPPLCCAGLVSCVWVHVWAGTKAEGIGAPGWQLLTFNSLNWWGQKVARGFTSSSTLKSPCTEALGFHCFAVLSLAYMRPPPHTEQLPQCSTTTYSNTHLHHSHCTQGIKAVVHRGSKF